MPLIQNRVRTLGDAVAVIGVGETDFPDDYRRARRGERYQDSYGYAAQAFKRALKDAELKRDDIDGLIVGPTLAYERTAEVLGLDVAWSDQADAANAVMRGMMAIASGLSEVIALVYGNDQRTARISYGGAGARGDAFLSYVYYAPWGLTSQGALYALMTRRYMELYEMTEAELGEVAVAQRRHAKLNSGAIMRKPLSLDDYMEAKYIVEPLRLFDYCLVNDGGVSLILTTTDRAKQLREQVVTIAGIGRADMNVDATSLRPRIMDFYRPGHVAAARDLYDMFGAGPEDIDCLQVYDSFSCHVLFALEGFGFCPEGGAGRFLREKGIGPGGAIPVNTAGGHLSESYMQGWCHQVEAVRQLRHECADRQVDRCQHVQYIADVAGKVASIIYRRHG